MSAYHPVQDTNLLGAVWAIRDNSGQFRQFSLRKTRTPKGQIGTSPPRDTGTAYLQYAVPVSLPGHPSHFKSAKPSSRGMKTLWAFCAATHVYAPLISRGRSPMNAAPTSDRQFTGRLAVLTELDGLSISGLEHANPNMDPGTHAIASILA